jgi:transcriptional regulator with XRE-family HTH domain
MKLFALFLTCYYNTSKLVIMQAKSFLKTGDNENVDYNSLMGRKFTKTRPKLGAHLAGLRVKAGLSQEDLAQRIGVLQQTIAFWEQTDKPPRSEILIKLADALGVKIETLLSGNGGVAVKKKGGPNGKLRKIFEDASRLPRRQQEKIAEFVSAFINQYRQSHSR